MASDTWEQVKRQAALLPDLAVLSDEATQAVVSIIAERFVADRRRSWWWEAWLEPGQVQTVSYEAEDPWDRRIPDLLPTRQAYVLLVTDETPEPPGAIRGGLRSLRELIGTCPFFEYALTDDLGTFCVFDTHHNTLTGVVPADGELT